MNILCVLCHSITSHCAHWSSFSLYCSFVSGGMWEWGLHWARRMQVSTLAECDVLYCALLPVMYWGVSLYYVQLWHLCCSVWLVAFLSVCAAASRTTMGTYVSTVSEQGMCDASTSWSGFSCTIHSLLTADSLFCENENPCANGGVCTYLGNSVYTCDCPLGFNGTDCTTGESRRLNICGMQIAYHWGLNYIAFAYIRRLIL